MLKFELYKKALLFFLQKSVIICKSSNQPVVPETTGIFNFKLLRQICNVDLKFEDFHIVYDKLHYFINLGKESVRKWTADTVDSHTPG